MNKESKTYKSVKTVSKSGAVSWRPRWVEFDSDGNKKIRNGKSQSSKAEADRFSRKMVDDLNTRDSLKLVAKDEALTVGQFALKYW